MRVHVEANPVEMPTNEIITKINIEIDISSLLEELKLFDALFTIELKIISTHKVYHYSFVKRNITESKVMFPMFVEGQITNTEDVSYIVHTSYISKE